MVPKNLKKSRYNNCRQSKLALANVGTDREKGRGMQEIRKKDVCGLLLRRDAFLIRLGSRSAEQNRR